MTESEELDLIRRVLTVFDKADAHSELYWRVGQDMPDEIKLFAACNDMFWWATADAEWINAENVAVLEQALVELQQLEDGPDLFGKAKRDLPLGYLSTLFAARVRKMRPQRPAYRDMSPEIAALFDACGPERSRLDEG